MGERKRALHRFNLTLDLSPPPPYTLQEKAFFVDPCLEALWDWVSCGTRSFHFQNSLFVSSRTRSVFRLNGDTWVDQMEIDSYLEWLRKQNNGPFFSAVAIAQIRERGARPLTLPDVRTLVFQHMLPGAYLLLCDTSVYDDASRNERLTRMRDDLHLHGVIFDDNLPPPYRGYLGKKLGHSPVI